MKTDRKKQIVDFTETCLRIPIGAVQWCLEILSSLLGKLARPIAVLLLLVPIYFFCGWIPFHFDLGPWAFLFGVILAPIILVYIILALIETKPIGKIFRRPYSKMRPSICVATFLTIALVCYIIAIETPGIVVESNAVKFIIHRGNH